MQPKSQPPGETDSSNRGAVEPILLALLCGRPQLMKHTQGPSRFQLIAKHHTTGPSFLAGLRVYQNDHSSSKTGGRYVLCIPCIFYTRCCSSVPSSRRVHNYGQGARAHQPGGECGCCSVRFLSHPPHITQTYITTCPTELSSGKFPPAFLFCFSSLNVRFVDVVWRC